MKDALSDAQIHTAQMLSTMSPTHPSVVAAKEAEQEIAQHLSDELDSAIRSVAEEAKIASDHTAAIKRQLTGAQSRLARLAKVRADYANVSSEVRRRSDALRSAENQLSEARASQAASHTASLLSRVDSPVTGAYPIGPGRSVILAGGCLGGFLTGLGLLLLTVPTTARRHETPAIELRTTLISKPIAPNVVVPVDSTPKPCGADNRRRMP